MTLETAAELEAATLLRNVSAAYVAIQHRRLLSSHLAELMNSSVAPHKDPFWQS